MNAAEQSNLLVGLDLGSSHATLVAAYQVDDAPSVELRPPGSASHSGALPPARLQVIGAARVANSGMKRGAMVNMDAVADSILDAIDEVERQTGLTIDATRVTVSSTQAQSENQTEAVSIKNNEVKASDIERLSSLARAFKAPGGAELIHNLSCYFVLDGKAGIVNPIGMWGSHLSSVFHRVLFPQADLHNIVRACNQAGLKVQSVAFEALASAEAALDHDEKEFGACVINIGASFCHVAVFSGGVPVFCKDYPIGAHHITKDLAVGLRTTQVEAERVKREFGQAGYVSAAESNSSYGTEEGFAAHTIDNVTRILTRADVCNIITPRVHEIFQTIYVDLRRAKMLTHLTKGIVLTGGGALLTGTCMVCEEVMGLHSRIGHPQGLTGLVEGLRTPLAATAIGSLATSFGAAGDSRSMRVMDVRKRGRDNHSRSLARSLWNRLREPFV